MRVAVLPAREVREMAPPSSAIAVLLSNRVVVILREQEGEAECIAPPAEPAVLELKVVPEMVVIHENLEAWMAPPVVAAVLLWKVEAVMAVMVE
jgi:hypothetical protein